MQQETTEKTGQQTISTPAAILLGAVIVALAIIFTINPRQPGPAAVQPDTPPEAVPAAVATLRDTDQVRGSRDAAVVVIEYSDSDCPFCQQFHNTMLQVLSDYDDRVAWAYRFYPLESHPYARTEAIALACAGDLGGDAAFWPYLDVLMNLTLTPGTESDATLRTIAAQHGISGAMLDTCMQDAGIAARVDAHTAEAQRIGARGTPFSVVVNQRTGAQAVVPGAMPKEALTQIIDQLYTPTED